MSGKLAGRPWVVVVQIALAVLSLPCGAVGPGNPLPQPHVEERGQERVRIGAIAIDKQHQRFSVPGTVINLRAGSPIEYLAVAASGYKSYESLFELGTSAGEFNLACILIGLDTGQADVSRYHFDPEQVGGDPVSLQVSWQSGGKTITRSPAQLFSVEGVDRIPDDWVYTGSVVLENGVYLAQDAGTLIGFVHDPASIIEHRTGLGIGRYGAAYYDPKKLPPAGAAITLTVANHGSMPESDEP